MLIAARNGFLAGKRLPYDAEVEYLESTGTQYIDTGAYMDSSSSFDATIAVTASGTQFVFGLYDSGHGATGNFAVAAASSGFWVFDRRNVDNRITSTVRVSVGAMTSIVAGGEAISVNGTTTYGHSIGAYSPSVTSYIFAWRRPNDTQIGFGKVRVYSCRLTAANGTRDFIPVRVGMTGALYDRRGVGGMNPDGSARDDGLYFNRGTGAFILGPDK